MTPFVLHYVSQHALGGHSIPADTAILDTLLAADIITSSEADKKNRSRSRAIRSQKQRVRICVAATPIRNRLRLEHQSPTALAVFKDLGVTPSQKLCRTVEAKPKKGAVSKSESPAPKQADAPEASKSAPAKSKEPVKELPKTPAKTATPKADSSAKPVSTKGALTAADNSEGGSTRNQPVTPPEATSKPVDSKAAKAGSTKKGCEAKVEPPKTSS